ncbi:hypothetical protein IscW_ISCW019632 [Ixodes scapularis]|uniref:Uncharacterized protein n=1 Tax=Ixodes scapularis TaxID=6945 RepID=B7PUE1_IXOSC|nr:hypothetical protein IscW_ISCW019632 [Ixodes scapularis]|eukprot:XP_002405963.1 hypothetical protein IscW_ISCW019632 [Ixodes scapularis]
MLKSHADCCVSDENTRTFSGSQTTTSASEPAWMRPWNTGVGSGREIPNHPAGFGWIKLDKSRFS